MNTLASGWVGLLVINWLLKYFNVSVIDKIFVVKFEKSKIWNSCCIHVTCKVKKTENPLCGSDAQSFLAHLLTQIYMHSDCEKIYWSKLQR